MRSNPGLNIEMVESVFIKTIHFLEENKNQQEIIEYINTVPDKFRPVTLEALSCHLVSKIVEEKLDWNIWESWFNYFGKDFYFFFYVGVGFIHKGFEIIAPKRIETDENKLVELIYEGKGYADALFSARKTIKGQVIPEYIPIDKIWLYDQGIGRRLLYYLNGNLNEVINTINQFDLQRQHNMLRGVGMAYSFLDIIIDNESEVLLSLNEARKINIFTGYIIGSTYLLSINLFSGNHRKFLQRECEVEESLLRLLLNKEITYLPINEQIKIINQDILLNTIHIK